MSLIQNITSSALTYFVPSVLQAVSPSWICPSSIGIPTLIALGAILTAGGITWKYNTAIMNRNLACVERIHNATNYATQYFSQKKQVITPLHEAVESGKLEDVELLIAMGSNVNARDQHGQTPLHLAADKGQMNVIEFLLKKSADINAETINGETPLHYAVIANRDEVVEFLIEQGAEVKQTLLHEAAQFSSKNIVELLLNNGAEVLAQDHEGNTPLHLAILFSKNGVIQCLLGRGADVDAKNNDGETPLAVVLNHINLKDFIIPYCSSLRELIARQKAEITENEHKKLFALKSFILIKEFSHFLELEGKITLDGEQITLEGLPRNGWFFDSLADFLMLFVKSEDGKHLQLSPKNQKIMEEALRNAHSHLTDDEVAQRISNRQLTLIEAGWTDHAICLGFFGNYLAICNGGPGPYSTIQLYKINPKLLTAEMIKQIKKNRNQEMGLEFFYRILPSMLSDTKTIDRDLICESFQCFGSFQEGSNCVLASKILGVYFAWAILLLIQKNQLKTFLNNCILENHETLERISSEPKCFTDWCKKHVFDKTVSWLGEEKFKESGLARISQARLFLTH
ncbi:MAG: Phosphocholine transferase AnkX [Chlamydiae bacterium]|nr:Phosphocholine transferase AnkX [Chlamydiota bacterium]